jgi:hypothetical protein
LPTEENQQINEGRRHRRDKLPEEDRLLLLQKEQEGINNRIKECAMFL